MSNCIKFILTTLRQTKRKLCICCQVQIHVILYDIMFQSLNALHSNICILEQREKKKARTLKDMIGATGCGIWGEARRAQNMRGWEVQNMCTGRATVCERKLHCASSPPTRNVQPYTIYIHTINKLPYWSSKLTMDYRLCMHPVIHLNT